MIFASIALIFVLILFCIVFIFVVFSQLLSAFTAQAPFVPVPDKVLDEIVNNLVLKNGSVLYDLGCGDGKVLVKALQKHPDIKAIGVEIAFLPYLLAKWKSRKYKNIEIRREDIFKTNISEATCVFLYLYPKVINKLITNIKTQCKPGTLVLSCDFELENTTPTKVVDLTNSTISLRGKKLFVYTT